MRRRCIERACAALLAAAPVSAQQLVYLPLDSATVVRLHLLRGGTVSGRLLVPFGPDSTRFTWCPAGRGGCRWDAGRTRRLTPAADVRRVDVRRGSRSTQGAVIGGAVLVGVAATFCALTDTGGCDPARGGFLSYVALPTALVGSGIGAIVGGGIPKWEEAP
ncbi:MAG: hypothetical protein HYS40_07055 [Gemmatimonadetes bacterium]|nr:hypothetical protein [Gemmatimonadota bacterium]